MIHKVLTEMWPYQRLLASDWNLLPQGQIIFLSKRIPKINIIHSIIIFKLLHIITLIIYTRNYPNIPIYIAVTTVVKIWVPQWLWSLMKSSQELHRYNFQYFKWCKHLNLFQFTTLQTIPLRVQIDTCKLPEEW